MYRHLERESSGRRASRRVLLASLHALGIALSLLLLAGCGGGGRGGGVATSTTATVTIHWSDAAKSRVALAECVTIDISGPGGFMTARVANRPTDSLHSVTTIPDLPLGRLQFILHARAQANGHGDILASAMVEGVAQGGVPLGVTAVMDGAIHQVRVTVPQSAVAVGESIRLTGTAITADDEVVLVPAATPITWLLSNPVCGLIDADGVFIGIHPGAVTVTATVPGSGVSGTGDITVHDGAPSGSHAALVLYDTEGAYGWYGHLYAVQLENLLKHFQYSCVMKPAAEYQSRELDGYDALFYFGSSYLTGPLPTALLDDVLATAKPVCWMGMNGWQLESHAQDLGTRYGFANLTVNDQPAEAFTVRYKEQSLSHSTQYPYLVEATITNPSQAAVLATCTYNAKTVPYIIRSGNFWHFAACPFITVDFEDKYLAFADLLHDILREDHPIERKAYIRIEDVAPNADQAQLRQLADTLYDLGVPFGICLIPLYRDPMGQFGYGAEIALGDSPAFVETLKYMVSKGGEIIHHGYTHQYGDGPNPFNGVSGVDYEFFHMTLGSEGQQIGLGPVPDDSFAWALDRVRRGKTMITEAGLRPVAWNTPHYMASEVDYHAFRQEYYYCLDRGLYFTEITGAQPTRAMLRQTPGFRAVSTGDRFWTQQLMPYALEDRYGLYRVPETLGYVTPHGSDGVPPTFPADLIRRAQAQLVVRDGWAGCYFHWYLDAALLRELVTGIQGLGYAFTRVPD